MSVQLAQLLPSAKPPVMEGNPSILLVDDEPELLAVCREALEAAGYVVHAAGNGQQALHVLEHTKVALVVTDLSMPQLDGMGLLRAMNTRGVDADVIFLTGYGTIENAVECLQRGASDYLLKPFDLRKLLATVQKVLDHRQERQAVLSRQKRQEPSSGNEVLKRLANLSQALGAATDLRVLVREFLTQLKDSFEPHGVALLVKNGEHTRPWIFWGQVFDQHPELRQTCQNVCDNMAAADGPTCNMQTLECCGKGNARGDFSLMFSPLANGPQLSGAVGLVRSVAPGPPGSPGPYGARDRNLLEVFAGHAAIALENLATNRRLSSLNMGIVHSYIQVVEAKDVYTRGHSQRVSEYGGLFATALGLSSQEQEDIRIAGLLHDIGKIGVPDHILNKPSKLDDDEFAVMRSHPDVAKSILSGIPSFNNVLPIVYHHHEHFDGHGYPGGLAGDDIPFMARLISVVDGFEAMTSKRAYQRAHSPREALAVLENGAGTQWDPELVEFFARLVQSGRLTVTC